MGEWNSMNNNNNKEQFLKELKDLMEKYNVTIGFSVGSCSDTHGLYDEKIVIDHRVSKDNWKEETWLETPGWWLTPGDIELQNETQSKVIPIVSEDRTGLLHTCPFKEEMNGDYQSLCDCDEEQRHQCAMDV
jgi:hypothetical protein